MSALATPLSPPFSPAESVQRIELHCFTYGNRTEVLCDTMHTLLHTGCALESRRATSPSQVEVYFDAILGAADELYGGLIGAGVEMTRDSHRAMTWLCTLRRHRQDSVVALRTVSIRMEMSFLSEADEEMGFVSAGLA